MFFLERLFFMYFRHINVIVQLVQQFFFPRNPNKATVTVREFRPV